jgi:hypothetical protein
MSAFLQDAVMLRYGSNTGTPIQNWTVYSTVCTQYCSVVQRRQILG